MVEVYVLKTVCQGIVNKFPSIQSKLKTATNNIQNPVLQMIVDLFNVIEFMTPIYPLQTFLRGLSKTATEG